MSNNSALEQPSKQTASDGMRDLIDSLYGASDMLLDNLTENKAEAAARAHWARRRVHKCKEMETELVAQAGHVVQIAAQDQKETPPREQDADSMDTNWILDVIDDLIQFATFQNLEHTRLALHDTRKTIAEQLG